MQFCAPENRPIRELKMLLRVTLSFVCLFISNHIAFAANFDCAQASSGVEKTICGDSQLNRADEEAGSYFFKLKDSLKGARSQELLEEQREWLKLRTTKCDAADAVCLRALYADRIHVLRVRYENLVPFALPNAAALQGLQGTCGFAGTKLPDEYAVYATGAYSGRKLDVQIDGSGHQATQFDIVVNSPDKPVALILGAYEPSIWNIGWTKSTRIVAVLATGYHRQAVAGLPKETPILISTYDNSGPCGYTYISQNELAKVNPLSVRVYGKPVDMVHLAGGGNAVVGVQVAPGEQLFTSRDITPEDFVDKSKPPAGDAGLRAALAKGLIRPITRQDLDAWADRKAKMLPKDALPPVAGGDNRQSLGPRSVHNGYVILKAFRVPAGLYGAHSATFFLADGVPYPEGELGHSALYDFNTMTCRGPVCGMR
jgi:uncharacterized protein YecT (DUF1311 family)